LTNEADPITESAPAFGSASATPKLLGAYLEVSRRLLLQSNAEEVLRAELRAAAGAAIDAAVVAGSGANGEPLGLLNTSGIGSITGTDLDYADLIDFQAAVATGEGVRDPSRLGWVGAVDVAELLKARVRFAGTDSPLWVGDVNDGLIDGKQAFATNAVPDGALLYGDWSGITLYDWEANGLQVSLDPFSKFQSGIVGMRLLLAVDLVVTRRPAFAVATSIT
jgi:HK97 family phage major capsid protein